MFTLCKYIYIVLIKMTRDGVFRLESNDLGNWPSTCKTQT